LTGQGLDAVARKRDPDELGPKEVGETVLWSGVRGPKPQQVRLDHSRPVQSVAFNSESNLLVTGGWAGKTTLRLWQVPGGQRLGELALGEDALAVAFSPDSRRVLVRGSASRTGTWELADQRSNVVLAHDGPATTVAVSPDGRTLLTGSADGTARLWNADSGQLLGQPLRHPAQVLAVAFSPDGRTVLTGCRDGKARLWEATTATERKILKQVDMVVTVAFSRDGAHCVTGCSDGNAQVWDVAAGEPVGRPLVHPGVVLAVAFRPDGRAVLTGCDDHQARVWDLETGELIGQPLEHQRGVVAVSFAPDGQRLLTASGAPINEKSLQVRDWYAGDARVWGAASGELLAGLYEPYFPVPSGQFEMVWSPGKMPALPGPALPGLPSPGDRARWIFSTAFSSDGRLAVTGSKGGTLQLWEMHTCRPLGPAVDLGKPITGVAFSPDDRTVVAACSNPFPWTVHVPSLLAGDATQLKLWAQVSSGRALNKGGSDEPLSKEKREDLRRRLAEEGGPPPAALERAKDGITD
jgi:WD40 repeat protein